MERIGLFLRVAPGPGVLHELTGIIARHDGDIASVDMAGASTVEARVYFEVVLPDNGTASLLGDLGALGIVFEVKRVSTLQQVYGSVSSSWAAERRWAR